MHFRRSEGVHQLLQDPQNDSPDPVSGPGSGPGGAARAGFDEECKVIGSNGIQDRSRRDCK